MLGKLKLSGDTVAGMALMLAAVAAMLMENSPFSGLYDKFLSTVVNVSAGGAGIEKPLLLWINDGMMAVFFLLVALEIKREFLEGKLSTVKDAMLPAIAAVGGMVVPALIYYGLNSGNPDVINGWAIPAATDIAFVVGILALFGKRVPPALKIFLLALAILDDLGAIVIIALFYTANLSPVALGLAGLGLLILLAFNRFGVTRISPYVLVGVVVWVCVLKSGVHATLAGVMVGLCIPLRRTNRYEASPLKVMEHGLHPYVMFLIMPVFAFANAGVSLEGFTLDRLADPIPLGISAGLFLGKQIGIFGAVAIAVMLGVASLPKDVNWAQLYGASLLAGIGFTMSLFIGTLAFSDISYQADVRIGVLGGSILSAVIGYLVLHFTLPKKATLEATKPA
ncbi:Na+/H+ antiporter NhaA [Aestuariispira insulae]|uniref:Na(+)/H(+) antiporter NhaA n=1 Tax=Aestuariispira insulae TaxID=1461337 RepID=A0A3D9HRN1_9PROT|nr:Na+/H+ antiporter NhaA [Aestuariispira insulae]RED52157.1 sodium/proton antiporter (NhaA family) [Aestuariispira insulae]